MGRPDSRISPLATVSQYSAAPPPSPSSGSASRRSKVIYRDGDGPLSDRLLYRDDEPSLELLDEMGRPWSFGGDGDLLRLVSEAYRIHLVSDTRLGHANIADNRI